MIDNSLSWSWTRDRLFRFCPRAYFLYYHDAGDGREEFADEQKRLLYRLKKLTPGSLWLDTIFTTAFRSELPFSEKIFAKTVKQLFSIGRTQILHHDWERDPGCLNIEEIYYGEITAKEFLKNAGKELKRRIDVLNASPLPEILAQVQELDRCLLEYPIKVEVDAITTWTNPVMAWRERNQLIFMNQLNLASEPFTATLQCVLAMQKFQLAPSQIYFIGYNYKTGDFRDFPAKELEISLTLDKIKKLAFELDPIVYNENQQHCPTCRFRQYCHAQKGEF